MLARAQQLSARAQRRVRPDADGRLPLLLALHHLPEEARAVKAGRRVDPLKGEDGRLWLPKPEPGDYLFHPTEGWYVALPPDRKPCAWGSISEHTVTEHDDATITVEPSILRPGVYHGYLRRGEWTDDVG